MEAEHYIGLGGVIATIFGVVVTWIVAKRTQETKRLSYRITAEPLFKKQIDDPDGQLEITYRGELVPEPVLLAVDIVNTGNKEIENPPIEIEAVGATYIIPGYFESVPPGYEDLWTLDRTDAESCAIRVEHLNPGQVVKARFLLDEIPSELPVFKCPMAGVEIRPWEKTELSKIAELAIELISPSLARTIANSFLR